MPSPDRPQPIRATLSRHGGAVCVALDKIGIAVALDGTWATVNQRFCQVTDEAGLAEGIGLISMRERVCFVGGTFNLSSVPGQGTRVEARVPIARE